VNEVLSIWFEEQAEIESMFYGHVSLGFSTAIAPVEGRIEGLHACISFLIDETGFYVNHFACFVFLIHKI
jgi:hypothetical protein